MKMVMKIDILELHTSYLMVPVHINVRADILLPQRMFWS